MILIYITCESREQAEDIGRHLLKKRLAGCINIIPGMHSYVNPVISALPILHMSKKYADWFTGELKKPTS